MPEEGKGRGCRCGQGHGKIADAVDSVHLAARDGGGGCRIKRMKLLDGCVDCGHSHNELHTLGLTQLGPKRATSLWAHT